VGRQGPPLADDVIRSPHNRTLKLIRSLRQRKTRETERAFVVEGFRAIADGIAAGAVPHLIALREGSERETEDWFGQDHLIRVVDAEVFDSVADTVTPQGALAVFPFPDLDVPNQANPLYLVLDQVRDPGNLGTLIRSAAASGVSAVFVTEGTVDPFNPKVVRSAVGAHFRVPVRWLSDQYRNVIEEQASLRVLADAESPVSYDELDWTGGVVLVVGSEAHGATGTGRAITTTTARIPLAGNVESLNAAVAGAVILFEVARQRRRQTMPGAS
jgi:TrmH family RNA methyltransferase